MQDVLKSVIAIPAAEAAPRPVPSHYPKAFAGHLQGRVKHPLGDVFGLKNLGVNLTRVPPGAVSSLHHRHTRQDEFVYVLEGRPTLVTDDGEMELAPGMCAGFPADGAAHHLQNLTDTDVVFLEVGDRAPEDTVIYPADDLESVSGPDGKRRFTHKDGTPY
ncbi:cupin domain-containing protein [Methylorubrum extorquens]